VFKVREIMVMPTITAIANAPPHVLGMANIRGQIIPVIDLPSIVGCVPKRGLTILMVTEYARTTQAFAVEEVDEIVRLELERCAGRRRQWRRAGDQHRQAGWRRRPVPPGAGAGRGADPAQRHAHRK
jgi:chemotaxis signal transduction protein